MQSPFNRHVLAIMIAASLGLSLGACQRTPTDDADAAAVADATPEAPVVEMPAEQEVFQVEAPAGEESTMDNGAAEVAATAAETAPAEAAASADPLASAPDNSAIKATSFKATGNEPFWGFDVDDKMMNFSTLENQAGWMLPVKRSGDGNKVTYSGVHEGKAFAFSIIKRACQDTMSGQKYDYTVRGQLNGNTYDGCGSSK